MTVIKDIKKYLTELPYYDVPKQVKPGQDCYNMEVLLSGLDIDPDVNLKKKQKKYKRNV